jgi:hypothetical protein
MLALPAAIAMFLNRVAPNRVDESRGALAAFISGMLLAYPILQFWPSEMRFDISFFLLVFSVVSLALAFISFPVALYVSRRWGG